MNGSGTTSSTPNGLNQIVAQGGATLTWDARGNLSNDGTTSYAHTAENLLTTAGSAGFAYDPLGRLSGSGYTNYGFDYAGGALASEFVYTNGQLLRRYVHGPGVDEPLVWYEGAGTTDRRFLHADERGSIVAVTNSAGSVMGLNLYDEYGRPSVNNIGRFQYTGQTYMGEAGLYYYKARWYNPRLGRFMETDPIGYGSGMNLYAYVGNDPVNFTDPSGMKGERPNPYVTRDDPKRPGTGTNIPGRECSSCTISTVYHVSSGGASAFGGRFVRVAASALARSGLDGEIIATASHRWVSSPLSQAASLALGYQNAFNNALDEFITSVGDLIVPPLNNYTYRAPLCGCFEAGTLVATPNGLRPIEEIAVGDLVLAVNEATGEIAPKPVTDLIRPEPKPLYRLQLLDAGGEAETFHATDDHPWKVEGKGWVETLDLTPGDRIDTGSGADMIVTSLTLTDRIEPTYNLTVAEFHTFMVGEDRAVVHNACITFKTSHYGPRLEAIGLNPQQVNRTVAGILRPMVPNMSPRGDVHGRVSINGINLQWRAQMQPNGTVNVGTIHEVWGQ